MPSSLEQQRLENIRRNQELLKQLELENLSNSISSEVKRKAPPAKKPAKKRRSEPRVKREPEEPVIRRRSRRLEGKKADFEIEQDQYVQEQAIKQEKEQREKDRVEGERKLEEIMQRGDWKGALRVLSDISAVNSVKISQGDYFDLASKKESDPIIKEAREKLSNLSLLDKFDPPKLTTERIYSMAIHPSKEKRLVFAGDKMGELGLWDPDQSRPAEFPAEDEEEEEDPEVSSFKIHSRSISRIIYDPFNPQKMFTGSYDGSIRSLDLTAIDASSEAFVYDSDPRDPVGISDFAIPERDTIYLTTLQGEFGIHDLREKPNVKKLFRCHEKKIGGFAVNPLSSHQIATASLDRTFKVWDVRYTKSTHGETIPHLYGEFQSRLSISCVDWNRSGQIVVNGYDDKIHVFDMSEAAKSWKKDTTFEANEGPFAPKVTLKHNCQTGRWVSILKARWQESPADGLHKFVIANMNRYLDIYAANGRQLAHLGDERMTAVPAVAVMHPTEPWLVGGSASGKVYLWQ
ncbi:DNA damage-binding protein Cmr1p [Trichomonascus vanleenenianus]|uniref:Cmr1p n=1 Tax=Trichomonascus vanleenenianus TaxID=2268995 RepID=UPI003ECA88C4